MNNKSPTRNSWSSMKTRCNNKNDKRYKDYGGRGISYCKEWECFEEFLFDMGERPKGMTLDRINNDLGYSKENCRWTTPRQQAYNRRMQYNNSTGFTGVYVQRGNSYVASVFLNGKKTQVYCGPSKEEAIKARKAALENILEEVRSEINSMQSTKEEK